jgi:hypothetical protein
LQRQRLLVYATTAILTAFNLLANYPPSLARLQLGFVAISLAMLFLRGRARAIPIFTVSLVLGMTLLFPYTDYFRSESGYSMGDLDSPIQTLVQKPDYDAFQMISNTESVSRERGFAYGRNLLGALLFFVPRAAWPDKPRGTGWTVGEEVGYPFLNLSSPLWAEFDYSGGIVLVLVGFYLYGRAAVRIEQSSLHSPAGGLLLAYAAGTQTFLLRGDLLNAVACYAPGALLLLVFVAGVRRVGRGTPRSGSVKAQFALGSAP